MLEREELEAKYRYESNYVEDVAVFKQKISDKSIIPHQVEIQPGPLGNRICWLECPFCYGKSANDTGERLLLSRYIEVLNEIADGGCNKIIVAGWATDPLNYTNIDDLVETIIKRNQIIGFNTRALRMSDRLIELLSSSSVSSDSYLSVSIDAGSDKVYNKVHDVQSDAKLYSRVLHNIERLASKKANYGASLDISAAYLINDFNYMIEEVKSFINDFKSAGCSVLRFSFPQLPRGDEPGTNPSIPNLSNCHQYVQNLKPYIDDCSNSTCKVIIIEPDLYIKPRTTPCFARFIYPTIGFDGSLYHCSQSAGPNFRAMSLGNLTNENFWDLYYNYDVRDYELYFETSTKCMEECNCRCDRKEHTVNESIIDNEFLNV
tara:strand:+ start:1614 stop:2741 length:1128 start_codon:yes stop_codon:yes gene_type:complete